VRAALSYQGIMGKLRAAEQIAALLIVGAVTVQAAPAAGTTKDQGVAAGPYAVPFLPPLRRIAPGLDVFIHLDMETVLAVSGGLSSGGVPTGVLQVGAKLDTTQANLWSGGLWELSLMEIQTGGDLAKAIGAVQIPSNIWAPDAFRLYQLSYRQAIGPAKLRFGVMDLNYYFDTTAVAGQLMNASFGISPTLTSNAPIATFPDPGLGVMGDIAWGDGWSALAGLWQGNPQDRNLSAALRGGALYLGEIRRRWGNQDDDKPGGVVKLGLWHFASAGPDEGASTGGAYGVGEARWEAGGTRGLAAFLQLGASPGEVNPVPYYLGMGARIKGLVPGREEDTLNFGVARAWLRDLQPETVWELNYSLRLYRGIYVQPDLQWVMNPGGVNPDALVAGLRVHLEM